MMSGAETFSASAVSFVSASLDRLGQLLPTERTGLVWRSWYDCVYEHTSPLPDCETFEETTSSESRQETKASDGRR